MMSQINTRYFQVVANTILFVCFVWVGFITFYNSFDNAFLMDDFPMLVGNLSIGTPDFLQLDSSAKGQVYFRPVTHILNLITFQLFGTHPAGYHVVNLMLLVTGSFIFFLLIDRVFLNRWIAAGAAIIFLMHPINSVCVNYKNATGNSFLILAMGMALWHAFADAQRNSLHEKILTVIWLLLALLCHEIALAFPLYLLALLGLTKKFPKKVILRACFGPAIVTIVYFLFRLQFAGLGSIVSTISGSFINIAIVMGQIILWYVSKLIGMQDITLMWDVPKWSGTLVAGISVLGFLLAVMVSALVYLKKYNSSAAVGLAWFMIGFVPVIFACSSRPWFGIIAQPFWLAMSSFGLFLCIFSILYQQSKYLMVACLIVWMLFIFPAAWRYNDLWGSPIRYSEYWMKISPKNFFPRFWLAYSLMNEKKYDRAKDVLTGLIKGGLCYEWTYGNLGIAEYYLQNYSAAQDALSRALQFNPSRGDTHYYLGMVFKQTGEMLKAKKAFQAAARLSPEIVDARIQLEALQATVD